MNLLFQTLYCPNNECDVNAHCSYIHESYTCKCNFGYVGDGTTCTPPMVLVLSKSRSTWKAPMLINNKGFKYLIQNNSYSVC